ncbi:unnamed protein product [Larinioides sclopetarius]|uniref:Uncharacterized protein n=1 Tax=Larinioides sclopetarius TaxID=280406 RepID=A0AAV1ZIE8_9ARAC
MVVLLLLNRLLSCQLLASNKTNTNLPCKFLSQQHSLPGQYLDPPHKLNWASLSTRLPCQVFNASRIWPVQLFHRSKNSPGQFFHPSKVSHPTYLLKQQYSKFGSTPPLSSPCASPYSSVAFSVLQSAPPPLSRVKLRVEQHVKCKNKKGPVAAARKMMDLWLMLQDYQGRVGDER